MEEQDLEIFPLTPDSDEYKKIETTFLKSSHHHSVAPVRVVQVSKQTNEMCFTQSNVVIFNIHRSVVKETLMLLKQF